MVLLDFSNYPTDEICMSPVLCLDEIIDIDRGPGCGPCSRLASMYVCTVHTDADADAELWIERRNEMILIRKRSKSFRRICLHF